MLKQCEQSARKNGGDFWVCQIAALGLSLCICKVSVGDTVRVFDSSEIFGAGRRKVITHLHCQNQGVEFRHL